jgi:hypothetical protein
VHGHPPTVGVFLKDARPRLGSRTAKQKRAPFMLVGQMSFYWVQQLSENSGDQPFEAITIELKA